VTTIPRKPSASLKAKTAKAKKAKTAKAVSKAAPKKASTKPAPKKAASAAKKSLAKKAGSKKAAKTSTARKAAPKKIAAKTPAAKTPATKAAAPKRAKPAKPLSPAEQMLAEVKRVLDDGKAEDIVTIDMAGKSVVTDYMVIATGRSQRQLAALAENLRARLKMAGKRLPHPEGIAQGDWVLLDAGDVVVHLFRPEARAAYNLEKMWSQPFAESDSGMEGLVKERPGRSPQAQRMAEGKLYRPDFRQRGQRRRR
jgi:ribosome-associated protein